MERNEGIAGVVSLEDVLTNLARAPPDRPAVTPHTVENIQDVHAVRQARNGYVEFLRLHYPELTGISSSRILCATTRQLYETLNPEMYRLLTDTRTTWYTILGHASLLLQRLAVRQPVAKQCG